MYLDVNRFKQINDSYGHEVGDQVLKAVASYISRYWRGSSYRIGGDEFVLVGKVTPEEVSKLKSQFELFPFASDDKSIAFNVSLAFGASPSGRHFMSIEEVIHEADVEMYQHKQAQADGKNGARQAAKVVSLNS
ncbi:GGDEF domain-containing protein [Vibrio sp. M250220]|uniref:GGDEF domain-containing protein n=1 Tax=Vibrio sp. M250220 TaxID=3020894 RepID=UPI003FCD6ACE